MKAVIAFLRAMRIVNLLITLATLYLAQDMFVKLSGMSNDGLVPLNNLQFFLLSISVVLIMAGGNIINDYFDVEVDIVNLRKSNMAEILGRKNAFVFWAVLSLLGLISGLIVSLQLDALPLWTVQLGAFLLLLLYSASLKRFPFIGNLIIAMLCGIVPYLPIIFAQRKISIDFEPRYSMLIFLGLFAFMITMVREITKDLEDMPGDFYGRRLTLPMLFGMRFTKMFIDLISMLLIYLLVVMILHFYPMDVFSSLYLGIAVLLPYLIYVIVLHRAKNKTWFHRMSQGLKYILLSGLIYGYLYSLLIL